jgi:chitin-binding protein
LGRAAVSIRYSASKLDQPHHATVVVIVGFSLVFAPKDGRNVIVRRLLFGLSATSILVPAVVAMGHGSMSQPISRVYSIYQEGPKSPSSDAARWATNNCDTQAFYDWHELSRNIADYENPDSYKDAIADGEIVGAGREKYSCLNEPRDDWPATNVASGDYLLTFFAHVPHDPSYFRVWVTKDGYDPLQPLTWDGANGLEELAVGDVYRNLPDYHFQVNLPERTGRHIIYVAWQRIDPVGECFFAACDVIFDESVINPTIDDLDIDSGIVEALDIDFKLDSAWSGTFNGSVVITNPNANAEVHGWELSWQGDPNLETVWNGVLEEDGDTSTVAWEAWNQDISPGESVTFGFSGTGDWPPAPEHVMLNNQSANVFIDGVLYSEADDGHEHPDCVGDFNGDMMVNVDDFSVFLQNFGSTNAETDLNSDGTTDVQDFSLFVIEYGNHCMH